MRCRVRFARTLVWDRFPFVFTQTGFLAVTRGCRAGAALPAVCLRPVTSRRLLSSYDDSLQTCLLFIQYILSVRLRGLNESLKLFLTVNALPALSFLSEFGHMTCPALAVTCALSHGRHLSSGCVTSSHS